ncbi:MAG TPA: methylated-DNA--[protein]-cysteine S-methyltransferase [Caulobacterales bacterium]|nr:methylated-DNA--[protein]-cysteine S-methyltransferase [Caulobacterales bacterium]
MIRYDYKSPVDTLTLIASDDALTSVFFENNKHGAPPEDVKRGTNKIIDETRRQLDAYFAGKRTSFDLPLAPSGTPFQLKVWKALSRIPYGATRSYGQIAAEVGAPQASRAVGAANGRNPIPVIVPCHRVIGADGSLTGFGGGMERKRFLLQLEQSDALILRA